MKPKNAIKTLRESSRHNVLLCRQMVASLSSPDPVDPCLEQRNAASAILVEIGDFVQEYEAELLAKLEIFDARMSALEMCEASQNAP